MIFLLFLIPIAAFISSIILYRFNGKREFLRMDFVQFSYAFVYAPLLFVWMKSFLLLIMKNYLGTEVDFSTIFIIDTAFSVFFLYIYAFVVIHALTKSFNLKVYKDPLFDLFEHSEYYHLWLSHLVMFVGVMLIISVFSLANIFSPLDVQLDGYSFYAICALGGIAGAGAFLWFWLSDPKQEEANFSRVIKLFFGFFFMIQVTAFYIFDVPFKPEYVVFWFGMFFFTTTVIFSFFAYKSERAQGILERVSVGFKHKGWEFKKQLFEK